MRCSLSTTSVSSIRDMQSLNNDTGIVKQFSDLFSLHSGGCCSQATQRFAAAPLNEFNFICLSFWHTVCSAKSDVTKAIERNDELKRAVDCTNPQKKRGEQSFNRMISRAAQSANTPARRLQAAAPGNTSILLSLIGTAEMG